VSIPPFEEIEARARTVGRKAPRDVRRVFTLNRLTALGWAATIVLAVGVGWLARGSLNFGSPAVEDFSQRGAVSRETPAATDVSTGAAEADRGAALETAPTRGTQRQQNESETAEAAITPPAAADERLEMAPPPQEPERTDILAVQPIDVRDPESPPAAKADEPHDAVARQVVADVQAEEQEREAAGRGAAPSLGVQLNEAYSEKTWRRSDRAEAERHIGDTLRAIEDLPIDSVRIGEVNGQPAAIVAQTLSAGDLLEIVQWQRNDTEQVAEGLVSVGAVAQVSGDQAPVVRREVRAAAEPARPQTSWATDRGGIILVLRARVSSDSLAALADRIRP
jgi:hypothetical protein